VSLEEVMEAIRADDATRLRRLMKLEPDLVHAATKEGSLILTAVYCDAHEALQVLLQGTDLDVLEAAAVGSVQRIAELLESDPDLVEAESPQGFTPLSLAAFFGHEEAVAVLLRGGADVDRVQGGRNANTALDAAVAAGHRATAEILLQAGAQVNPRSAGGFTPLHKAAFRGDLELVQLLLSHGSVVDARSEDGRTPLDMAMEASAEDVIRVLQRQ
jgi:ankyrin repeat protein